jgi:hypothetical protein
MGDKFLTVINLPESVVASSEPGGVIVKLGGNLLVFRILNGQSSHSRLTINL